MMKKIIAAVLSLIMLLGCAAAAAEEAAEKVSIGTISINGAFTLKGGMPEGYQVKPVVLDRDQVIAFISSEDPTKPLMMLSVAYDETYSDVFRMNELDQEALELLEKTFTDMDPTVELSYGETGLGTELLIAKQTEENSQYIDFMSIYQGYFVEFVLLPGSEAENQTLTDEQIQMCVDFLTDLDFVPATLEEAGLQLAGTIWDAKLGKVDPETNTLKVTLRENSVVDAEEVALAEIGDKIALARHEEDIVEVESKVTDEYGDVILNDEIELRKREDGNYTPYRYEAAFMNDVAVIEIPLTEQLVFLDGVDPETGDVMDEPMKHTAAELAEMITSEEENNGIGFSADNVQITFDEDGDAAVIQRFYVPWQ